MRICANFSVLPLGGAYFEIMFNVHTCYRLLFKWYLKKLFLNVYANGKQMHMSNLLD